LADAAAAAPPYPRPAYAWTVVGILFCTAVLSYTDRQVLSLLVDPIRGELHVGDARMSLLLGTAFALVYGVAGIPLGYVADRASRRNLILAGVTVWAIGTLLCGLAHDFAALFGARIVVGLGEAVLSPAAISLISDCFPPQRRGAAVGLYFTGIAVGVGGSIFIGGALLGAVNAGLFAATPLAHWPAWRLVFLATGAPSLLWGLVILLIREPVRRGDGVEAVRADEPPFAVADLLRAAPLFVAVAVASLVDNAVGAWAPSLMIRRFHADAAQVGLDLGLLLMVGYGGGMLLGGVLADRAAALRGPKGKAELCLVAALACLPVSLLINGPAQGVAMAGVPLYFALSAVVTASGLSAILDATPNRVRGLAMAVSFFLNVAVGAGFGPSAVTLASDHLFGGEAGLGPAIATVVVGAYLTAVLPLGSRLMMARRT
jgi:MFS family permease